MNRPVALVLLLTGALTLSVGSPLLNPPTTEPAPSPVVEMRGPGAAPGAIDAFSFDSLAWKTYFLSDTYLWRSDKSRNPTPVRHTRMLFMNQNSVPCMDPQGNYIYEVLRSGWYMRQYNTWDGAFVQCSLKYQAGSYACGTDGRFLYVPRGTTVDKYTLDGGYVSSTGINRSVDYYGFAVVNDTVWAAQGNDTLYYGYACSRFTNGSITQDAVWNVGSGTPAAGSKNIAFDGTYYFVTWGGTSNNTLKRFNRSRQPVDTGLVSIDARSVMCRALPGTGPSCDVGCTRIVAPAGVVGAGTPITPACSVYNFGTLRASAYAVRLRITGGYDALATDSVRNHLPGTWVYVSFPPWTAGGPGTYVVSCSTKLVSDLQNANDKQTGTVIVPIHNVGATAIRTPSGLVDSGAALTPACSVFNFGNVFESYTVRLKLGTGYNNTVQVNSHAPGTAALVTFPAWTPLARGTVATSCSTQLAGDVNPANDRKTGSADVAVHDVGVTAIVAPGIQVMPGHVTPQVRLRNYGTHREGLVAAFSISGTAYATTVNLSNGLPVGADTIIEFPDWEAHTGTYTARCSLRLVTDQHPANDTLSKLFQVLDVDVDVGVAAILIPLGTYESSAVVVPRVRVTNYGDDPATFPVAFRIDSLGGPVYSGSAAVTGLGSGLTATVIFDTWVKPHIPRDYVALCSTGLSGDVNPGNDTLLEAFTITYTPPPPETGWVRKTDIPYGPKVKKVKDGGALACADESEPSHVYAFKGNNRYEFYRYSSADNVWTTLESIPAIGRSGKKKAVKKGAALTRSPATGRVYALKGNSTLDFWSYSPSDGADLSDRSYSWTQLADVPAGMRTLREGTGLAVIPKGDTDFVYLLKGSNTLEFYRYNSATDAWSTQADAPIGLSGRFYKNGSCLTYAAESDRIFALKAGYNEFYSYNPATDSWTTRAQLPLIGWQGKKKKVNAGAGIAWFDGSVYALKGGNTQEFWQWEAAGDTWRQRPDMPIGGGKRVKAGGALVAAAGGNGLYALKGNNTIEFWRYGFIPAPPQLTTPTPEVQAGSLSRTPQPAIRVTPNPYSTATTIACYLPRAGNISLRLYDITGKLVTTLFQGYRPAGEQSHEVRPYKIARGIYLLRLDTETAKSITKLVVE